MDNPQNRAEAVALFRFGVIAPATSPHLSPAERGTLVRELAACVHADHDGACRIVSRTTLDRWIRAYVRHEAPCIRAEMKGLRRRSAAAGG